MPTTKPTYDFEATWESLLTAVRNGGADAALNILNSEQDAKRRNAWYRFCYQGLSMREWPEKTLKPMVAVGEAAIAAALDQAAAAGDDADRFWWTDQANIHCYNVSANLADCWDDGFAREPGHFEKGLELANRADRMREQLQKPAASRAMATWAQGKHLLSLRRIDDARAAFERSLAFEKEVAASRNLSQELAPGSHLGLILCHGYLALTGLAEGRTDAAALYDAVIRTCEQHGSLGADEKADADVGLAQLRASRSQLGL